MEFLIMEQNFGLFFNYLEKRLQSKNRIFYVTSLEEIESTLEKENIDMITILKLMD